MSAGETLADDRLEQLALERRAPRRSRAVHGGRVDHHELHIPGCSIRKLFSPLLGTLVGGPLRVVGDDRLVEPGPRLGVKHVDRARVHDPAHARVARRRDHVLGTPSVDALEAVGVRQPLLGQAHRVEHELAAASREGQRYLVRRVTAHELDVRWHRAGCPLGVAHERAYVVPGREQRQRGRVAHLSGGGWAGIETSARIARMLCPPRLCGDGMV